MASLRRRKLLLFSVVYFCLNAVHVVANNDDIMSKLDALVHSLDRLSNIIDSKCKCKNVNMFNLSSCTKLSSLFS